MQNPNIKAKLIETGNEYIIEGNNWHDNEWGYYKCPYCEHKEHPTEKPANLLKFYIANSSHEGDIVLDPFMGCGSAGIACNELNRRFVGIEIDKEYYDKACKKLYKHS